ncbi:MAG: MBL fold metallo-hydrolase [Deltaproteobacteria bacterium]|nr:MBL fold metallo-hydrolase [Deltaproteobacteria bacterium]
MRLPAMDVLGRAAQHFGERQLHVDAMPADVLRLRLSSGMTRINRMEACAYLAGSLLVDSGFSHVGPQVNAFLARRAVDAVFLTHHHEDHAGNCGAVARAHGCPVYLRNPSARHGEGVAALRPYRQLWWGEPGAYDPLDAPARVTTGARTFTPVPIPGHSATHTALLEERTGIVFTGDLFVSRGASAVMRHEDPFQSITSLRRVADLEPALMLTGHALAVEQPARVLRQKADAMENAAAQVLELHRAGHPPRDILHRVFPYGRGQDRRFAFFTGGEFSRLNFVHACIRHAP